MASDPQIVAYLARSSRAPVTGSPYYSMLPANTIDLLHPLIQDVLFGTAHAAAGRAPAGSVDPRRSASKNIQINRRA